MKIEIYERGTDVMLVSRQGDGLIVPRKNETVTAHGKRYFVREVNHFYYRALTGADDFIEVMVEAE
jgi:hypothetical protein